MRQLILVVLAGYALTAVVAGDGDLEDLVVPQRVMKFIMDCRKPRIDEELIPVLQTDVDADGSSTSQQVTLLGIDELHASLKSAIESDEVTHHIINRIRQEISPIGPSFRTEHCAPTHNYINISVPPQELQAYHLHLERALQQNNNNLMDLINDIVTSKMTALQRSLEITVKEQTRQISENLARFSQSFSKPGTIVPELAAEPPLSVADDAGTPDSDVPQVLKTDEEKDDQAPSKILAEIVEAIKEGYEEEKNKLNNESATAEPPSVTSVEPSADELESTAPVSPQVESSDKTEKEMSSLTELLQGSPFSFAKRKRGSAVQPL